jgi:hypothetical protein
MVDKTCPACRAEPPKEAVEHKGHLYRGLNRLDIYAGRYRIDDFEVKNGNVDLYVTHLSSGTHFIIPSPMDIPVVESLLKTHEAGGKVIGTEFVQLEGEELEEAEEEAHEEWRR